MAHPKNELNVLFHKKSANLWVSDLLTFSRKRGTLYTCERLSTRNAYNIETKIFPGLNLPSSPYITLKIDYFKFSKDRIS